MEKRIVLTRELNSVISKIEEYCDNAIWFGNATNECPKLVELRDYLKEYYNSAKKVEKYLPEQMCWGVYYLLVLSLDEINIVEELNKTLLSYAEKRKGFPLSPLYYIQKDCAECEKLLDVLKKEF